MLRRRFSLRVHWPDLRAMLRFGLPTVPADASVYALQVADRFYLFRSYSHAAAGEYSVALQFATVVFVIVRGFQYAWPPLAYSIESDAEAARLYSLVTTYFVLATGVVVAAVALLGRWIVRLLAAPQYFGAHSALPWLALALDAVRALPGDDRDHRPRARDLAQPAGGAAGLLVNIALLLVLVPHSGAGLGIAGAGIALCGAYVAMLLVMHLLTRRLFAVGFQWRRLAQLTAILAGVAVSGELLLPTSGFAGIALRVAVARARRRRCCWLTRFFDADERAPGARAARRRAPARRRLPRRARRSRGIRRGPPQRPLTYGGRRSSASSVARVRSTPRSLCP